MSINTTDKPKAISGLTNGKVASMGTDGWESPQPFEYLTALALNPIIGNSEVWADDERILRLPADAGQEGAIGTTARDKAFEAAAGYSMAIANSLAEIKTRGYKKFCFYYETSHVDPDTNLDYKVKSWILNTEIGKSSESNSTNQAAPTFAAFSYPIMVEGVNLKANGGATDYIGDDGFPVRVYKVSSYPGDTGYDTFGDAVPTPTANP